MVAQQRGMGYRHRPPALSQRAASAWRGRRVEDAFEPTEHPPFPALFTRFGPMDQGALNACTGFGVAMGATLQSVAAGAVRGAVLSPRVPYWAARRREVGKDELVRDEGAFVDDVIWAFNAFGATEDQPWLHDISASSVNRRPSPNEFREGLRVRSELQLRMQTIVATGERLVQRLAHSLHLGQVCFLALPVAETFLEPGRGVIPAQKLERAIGYHFVCLLDWRPAGASYELLCGNSWGWWWGDGGQAWLSPELVAQTQGAWYLERVRPLERAP